MEEEKWAKDVEVKEFEWYLRDHIFWHSNSQGRDKFQKETLAKEMMNLYLRYRNSNLENLNVMANLVSDNLLSRKVIKMMNSDTDKSLELTSKLSRL